MPRFIFCLFGGFVLFTNSSGAQTSIGHSPTGRVIVELTQKEHHLAQDRENVLDLSHVKYDVVFKDQEGKELARSTYADVYGWDSLATPMSRQQIIGLLEWSPEEDFVILPAEDWEGYMGPFPSAVNLRRDKHWETKGIIDIDGWVSPTKFYMSWILDCDSSVAMFDAVTGEETSIRKDEGLFGYVLVENDSLGHVIIRSEPNNCANREQREQFISTCERWDFTKMTVEEIQCPN